jgi:hypothetical protein
MSILTRVAARRMRISMRRRPRRNRALPLIHRAVMSPWPRTPRPMRTPPVTVRIGGVLSLSPPLRLLRGSRRQRRKTRRLRLIKMVDLLKGRAVGTPPLAGRRLSSRVAPLDGQPVRVILPSGPDPRGRQTHLRQTRPTQATIAAPARKQRPTARSLPTPLPARAARRMVTSVRRSSLRPLEAGYALARSTPTIMPDTT